MQKEAEIEKKRTNRNFMKMWRMKRNKMHVKDVAARKQKKFHIKQVKELEKQETFISIKIVTVVQGRLKLRL